MRVAASKGVETILALYEKTGVDRKTLRAINDGKPVKETTLQKIADKLRVPMAHLVGSGMAESHDSDHEHRDQYRELKLQRLNAAALRKLAGENDEINWILKFDQISEDLEKLLLRLSENLKGWFFQEQFLFDEPGDNLKFQISHIKQSADIDKCVEELEQRDFKIFGGTYLSWELGYDAPCAHYRSRLVTAFAIVPKADNNPTMRIPIGYEPPQTFGKEPPQRFAEDRNRSRYDFIFVDGVLRWSRKTETEFTAEDRELILKEQVAF